MIYPNSSRHEWAGTQTLHQFPEFTVSRGFAGRTCNRYLACNVILGDGVCPVTRTIRMVELVMVYIREISMMRLLVLSKTARWVPFAWCDVKACHTRESWRRWSGLTCWDARFQWVKATRWDKLHTFERAMTVVRTRKWKELGLRKRYLYILERNWHHVSMRALMSLFIYRSCPSCRSTHVHTLGHFKAAYPKKLPPSSLSTCNLIASTC